MTIKKQVLIMLLLAALLLLSGCPNGALERACTTTKKTFRFESGPGTLLWYTAANAPEQRALTAAEAADGTVTLTVLKGSVTPVLLYRPGVLEPEGAIWPVSQQLDRTGGFSARMLWRLLTETDRDSGSAAAIREWLSHFNWQRFHAEAAKLEDPWRLDQQRVLLAIASGTFRKKDLKLSER